MGKWKAVRTDGEFEKFLLERGVPFPVRKLLGMMNSGGKFEYRLEDESYVELEIGRVSVKRKKAVPLGALQGVDDLAPSGEKIKKYAKMTGDQLLLTNVVGGDPEDCVDTVVTRVGDRLYKRMSNRKTGTFFVVQLEPLDGPQSVASTTKPKKNKAQQQHHQKKLLLQKNQSPLEEKLTDLVGLLLLCAYLYLLACLAKWALFKLYATTTDSSRTAIYNPNNKGFLHGLLNNNNNNNNVDDTLRRNQYKNTFYN